MKKLRKIALFLPSLAGGGAEKQMVNLANSLVEHNFKVDLVLAKAFGPYLSMVSDKVNIIDLRAARVLFALPKLIWYLIKSKPNILFSAMDHANIVALIANFFAGRRAKTVISIRTHISSNILNTQSHKKKIIFFLSKYLYRKSSAIITVSNGVANDAIKNLHLPEKLVHVVYNPVLHDNVFKLADQAVDHPWVSEDGHLPLILSVGRLEKEKNHPMLIKAFALLTKTRSARLLILGVGSLRNELQQLIKELNLEKCVSLFGFIDNPYAYMRQCDLFVLSSSYEGLGNVLIEALALSPRVVATDCPAEPREILEDGKYGKLVAVDDADALASAMLESLDNDSIKVDENSSARFKRGVVINKYIKLFNEVI